MSKKKLKGSDDNFHLLFDSLDDFVFLLDPQGHILKANSTVFKRLGYSRDELVNKHVQVVLPEEINVGTAAASAHTEIILAKDGSFIPVETRTAGGRWSGRKVVYSFSRDIAKLIEAEERFDTVFRTGAAGMAVSAIEDGRVIDINDAALDTLGYTRNDVIGKTAGELNLYNDIKQRDVLVKTLKEKGFAGDVPMEFRTKNGGLRSVLMSADIIRVYGRPCMLSVISDITERKAAEGLVLTTRARLEAADKAKNEFLANMSHELRTPLNGVIGMTDILLDTSLTPQQRDFADTVRGSADALLGVLNDILDFSKIEAGKLNLAILDFDLRTALEEIEDMLGPRARQKGLEFMLIIEPAVPSLLRGDPGRLRQVILNLAGNAVKFTSKGEVVVRVVLERESPRSVTLRFSVTDTGIGIPAEKVEMLFKAFTQGDASSTRRYGGAGLGLAISQQLVQMMGGTVSVESSVGKGSVFQFTARFPKQPAAALAAPEALVDTETDIAGLRVLVVDENSVSRRLLSLMLASRQCRHRSAPGAQSALELLRTAARDGDPFRIALLDMNLPDNGGEALGTAVRKDPALKDTLLIMMTEQGRRGDAARLEKIGFSGYLVKPIKQPLLYDCLTIIYNQHQGTGAQIDRHIVTRHSIAENKRRKIRILVAEDSITNRKLVLGILQKLGCRADVVTDGLEALKALETSHYHLVFMDCRMPRMDGCEAAQAIRKREEVSKTHIPIIAMTGSLIEADREKCTDGGMDDYITKPVSPDAVAQVIEKWLTGPEPREKAETEIFDRAGLFKRLMEDEDLVNEVIGDFLRDLPPRFALLKEALDSGDIKTTHRHAHTIKGVAGNIGALALQKTAVAVETAAQSGDLEKTAGLIPLLDEQFEILKALMQGHASGKGGGKGDKP